MAPHWRYILAKRAEAPAVQLWGVADGQPEGANGGFIMAGQGYTIEDRLAVEHWIAQRARGFSDLVKFEHGANWPQLPYPIDRVKCSGCEGATWGHRTGVSHGYS